MTIRNQKNIPSKTNEMDIEKKILKNEKECRMSSDPGSICY